MADSTTDTDETTASALTASTSRKAADRIADTAKSATRTVAVQTDKAVNATAAAFDGSPLAAIAGAIAVGAVAAVFIPTSDRELETLGPISGRMRDALDDAFIAAREAGAGELTAAGLTIAAASNGLGGVVGSLVKAATVASSAAATSVRTPRRTTTTDTVAEFEPEVASAPRTFDEIESAPLGNR